MKKNILKVMSLVLALMLVLTSSAFAAYTVDELSGVNAPVLIRDGIERGPGMGKNLLDGLTPHTTSGTYNASNNTYENCSIESQNANLLGFRDADGLVMEAGSKYVLSFDIAVTGQSNSKKIRFNVRRANASDTDKTYWSGRADAVPNVNFVIPANAEVGVFRHVELILDYTGVATLNGNGLVIWEGDDLAGFTIDIANYKLEKYIPSPEITLLSLPVNENNVTNIQSEYDIPASSGYVNLIGWKDGEGVTMEAGKKYRFTAELDIPTALTANRTLKLKRAQWNGSWVGRGNAEFATDIVIPSGTSGKYFINTVYDLTKETSITTGSYPYNGLLLFTSKGFDEIVTLSNPQLVDITEEFAVYQNAGENILGAPLTVDDAKYTGTTLPSSVTLTKLANSPNAIGWAYTDEFKLVNGKKYTMSFDWSVPSSPDADQKTINWGLSDANPNSDYKGWQGRGDYLAQGEHIRAYVSPTSLSGSVTFDFVYNPTDVSKGVVLWVTSASSTTAEYTLSNIKLAPTFEEIDIQEDGNEIVVIQNKKNANSFNDLIILAEYEGETLKSFDFTTPETIAEMNDEATIALRAKLSNVAEGNTVKMFRWSNFNTLDPIAAPVDVK